MKCRGKFRFYFRSSVAFKAFQILRPSHDTLFFPTTRAVETIYKLTFICNFEDETPAH